MRPPIAEKNLSSPLSDFREDEALEDLDAGRGVLGVHEPDRPGDRGEEGVAVLRREAEAHDLAPLVRDRERRRRHDGLREDAAVVAVVAAEREDLVRALALREGDEGIRL